MIQVPHQVKIFVGIEPLDFRNGFNGTAAACRQKIQRNPLEGGLFVFTNRSRTMIRLYLFDGHGEFLMTKRIAQGHFSWWTKQQAPQDVEAEHIYLLLRGADPNKIRFPDPWKKI